MTEPNASSDMSELGWAQLEEKAWSDLVDVGLPSHLAEVAREVGDRTGRRVRIYTMPILEAGCRSFAVPFLEEDGIIVDPSLLSRVSDLAATVAHQLGHLLDPRWNDADSEGLGESEMLAASIAESLLAGPSEPAGMKPMLDQIQHTLRSTGSDHPPPS